VPWASGSRRGNHSGGRPRPNFGWRGEDKNKKIRRGKKERNGRLSKCVGGVKNLLGKNWFVHKGAAMREKRGGGLDRRKGNTYSENC